MDGDAPAPELPGYTIRSVLGAGGFGTVYLAVQDRLGREVALKSLHTSLDAPLSRRRFEREGQVLAALNHPNLVRVFDFQDTGEFAYLALEYLPGGTLKDRLTTTGNEPAKLLVPQVMALARDLLAGLSALHNAGLVHRDVKPANILFRENGQAVLGDLGLSRSTEAHVTRLTKQGIVVGTVAYLAPEAMAGQEQTAATDLFAAGVTLYEALSGKHPTDYRLFPPGFRAPNVGTLRPDAPAALCDLIAELMDPDPTKRPASARDALPRLRSRASNRTTSGRSRPITGPVRRRVTRWALTAGCVLSIGALAALALRWNASHVAPQLVVQTGSRRLSVRVDRPGAALELQAYERRQGRLVKSTLGTRTGDSKIFEVTDLEPDTAYDLTLTDGPPGPSRPPIAQREARTRIEVEVLGLDDDTGGVWLRCTPEMRCRAARDAAAPVTVVGSGGALVKLPRAEAASTATTVGVELLVASGESSTLELKLPPKGERAGGAQLPIALMLNTLDGAVRQGDRSTPLVDWLCQLRPAFVCLTARADGTPDLDQPGHEALTRAGVPLYLGVDPSVVSTAAGWLPRARAMCASRAVSRFTVEPLWMKHAWEFEARDRVVPLLSKARAWFRKEIGSELILPASVDRRTIFGSNYTRSWNPELGEIEALDRGDFADQGVHGVRAGLASDMQKLGTPLNVRTVFSVGSGIAGSGSEEFYDALRTDRSGCARGLAFQREDFPDAVVAFPFDEVVRQRTVRGPWLALERMGRGLAGLKFQRRMSPHGTPSIATAAAAVHALCFQGGTRRAQVLINLGAAAQATFTPGSPGSLYVLDPKATAPAAPRTLTSTAPVDLKLEFPPVLFVEFTPVEARADDRVELLRRGASSVVSR